MIEQRQPSQSEGGASPGANRAPFRLAAIAEDLRLPLDEGAKKACFSLISSLADQGADVRVFTRYANPLLHNSFALPRNKLLFGSSFARALKAQAPNAILYMPASSGTLGAFVRAAVLKAQAPGVPLALLSLQYRHLPAFARHFGLHRYADIVFTQSQDSVGVFRSLHCETVRLPSGVDCATFHPVDRQEKRLLRSKYGFQDTDRIVLHVGHCKRDRNVMSLARLAASGLKAILVASTSTALDSELQTELEHAGVVVITDFVEAVQHYYQLADCYVFPVLHATSAIDAPLSVLEAMACNLPVVTTPFGALPAMFEPGGGLYFCDNEEEMLDLVTQVMQAPYCRTIEKVSPYSWDRAASVILERLKERISA